MARNNVYNKRMQKEIQRTVRSGLPELMKVAYVEKKFKVSAAVVALSNNLFMQAYRVASRFEWIHG